MKIQFLFVYGINIQLVNFYSLFVRSFKKRVVYGANVKNKNMFLYVCRRQLKICAKEKWKNTK